MEINEIKPFLMDFLYSEPMPEVARAEDVRFRGYPHDPQLKINKRKKKRKSCQITKKVTGRHYMPKRSWHKQGWLNS